MGSIPIVGTSIIHTFYLRVTAESPDAVYKLVATVEASTDYNGAWQVATEVSCETLAIGIIESKITIQVVILEKMCGRQPTAPFLSLTKFLV